MKKTLTVLTLLSVLLAGAQGPEAAADGKLIFSNKQINSCLAEQNGVIAPGFHAVKNGKWVNLSWTCLMEEETETYLVQKSRDSINFETVTEIKSNGDGGLLNYQETDYQPYNGNSYYRLQITNKNGFSTYSALVPVSFENGGDKHLFKRKQKKDLFRLEEVDNKEMLLVLKDKEGRECYSKFIIVVEDRELYAVDIEKRVNPGKYLVIATSFNKMYGKNVHVR